MTKKKDNRAKELIRRSRSQTERYALRWYLKQSCDEEPQYRLRGVLQSTYKGDGTGRYVGSQPSSFWMQRRDPTTIAGWVDIPGMGPAIEPEIVVMRTYQHYGKNQRSGFGQRDAAARAEA